MTPTHLGFEEYDVASQTSISHHYLVTDGQLETFSVPFRYVWPSELDLMARLAGMTLRERWNDWNREPFTSDSRQHVSVWEKPGAVAKTSQSGLSEFVLDFAELGARDRVVPFEVERTDVAHAASLHDAAGPKVDGHGLRARSGVRRAR